MTKNVVYVGVLVLVVGLLLTVCAANASGDRLLSHDDLAGILGGNETGPCGGGENMFVCSGWPGDPLYESCESAAGGGCIHKVSYLFYVCENTNQTRCEETARNCGIKKYCDSDGESCNYGSGDPEDWWCYDPGAECGMWMQSSTTAKGCDGMYPALSR